ncbi:hypothetical protein V6N11_022496 [Hibiscus sabdariffa]|uniref:Leucine-rich repeat-containing N-terminal plant-type domain-containing protein n=1 Tax=Hibiscus sabdariffa TaxID=183260 RepID=A0ABR2TJE2_9ROSI
MGLVTFISLILLCLNSIPCFCAGISKPSCIQSQRQALLKIKHDLIDYSNMFADWRAGNGDCCKWVGVFCDKATGHVTELRLGSSNDTIASAGAHGRLKLGGKLNPALLDLMSLSYLDLSNNDFDQTPIPRWFWNLASNLQYLNISGSHFQGEIPDFLAIRVSLLLDLSYNNFTGSLPVISLNATVLVLSNNALSGSMSQFLCHRKHRMKLEVLGLGGNLLSGEIPDCWEKWGSLVAIELWGNNFSGKIPSSVGALASLQSLHLSNNSLDGEMPKSLSNLTELLTLDFSANQLSGEIPPWMGERLSKLIIIGLRSNMLLENCWKINNE